MQLQFIPLFSALLPALAVHLCYLLAAHLGHVPWCFPYVDSCTSISAVGRQSPENYIFRALMIPTAVIMMVYWKLSYEWLKTLKSQMTVSNRTMLYCGVIACFGLISYTTMLGSVGDVFRMHRRIGVTLFYVLTFLAQFIMTGQIACVVRAAPSAISRRIFQGLLAICLAILVLGATSLLLQMFYKDYSRIEDAFEWVITFFVFMHFFVTYFAWKYTGFRANFAISNN